MITIYGKQGCPYCEMAKNICTTAQLEHTYIDIFSSSEAENTYKELSETHNHFTVPLILQNDDFIGGFTELQQKLSS
jgi:glutaredoxin 1